MLIVDIDPQEVERRLLHGQLACPGCAGELRPWSFARPRKLRDGRREITVRPRRSICHRCLTTHVLLAAHAFVRRRDFAEVIVAGLAAKAHRGRGHRHIARALQLPETTVRGWLRAFAANAEAIRFHFTLLAAQLDAQLPTVEPRGSPFADAFEAIEVAHRAAERRFGRTPLWGFASAASGGRLVNNTTSPFPVASERDLMPETDP